MWKQDPRIQELEEDGSQRDGGAALPGRGCGICGHVSSYLTRDDLLNFSKVKR